MLQDILNLLKEHNVFLTGGAGVGKTYLTQAVIAHYKDMSKNVIKLGSTGISAVNIGGVSIHSFFKFGICSNFGELAAYDKKQKSNLKKVYEILDIADLIIIDEISMVSANIMDMIKLRVDISKFKGKFLVVGDFYQLPPVRKDEKENQNGLFEFKHAFNSSFWSSFKFKNIELKISKRTNDTKFYEILKSIRIGKIDDAVVDYLNLLRVKNYTLDENTTMLFGRNKDADEVNETMLNNLKTPLEISFAEVAVLDRNLNDQALLKWVDTINSPKELHLKIGAKIIFVVNYPFMGYHNGERGRIVDIVKENGECIEVIIQKDNGSVVSIQKHIFTYTKFVKNDDKVEQITMATFSQFPFKLAYALTIHKSQGMSINNLFCNLNQIFANGQLYVALSRATDPANLKLFYNKDNNFNGYLKRVAKIDSDVKEFYNNTNFENIKEC